MVRNALAAMRREYPVRVYQVIALTLALTATWAIGIVGAVAWANEQREASEYRSCVSRVEGREQLRGALTSLFGLIEERSPDSTFAEDATALLDKKYPELSVLVTCGTP
jgi:hypothetical protein